MINLKGLKESLDANLEQAIKIYEYKLNNEYLDEDSIDAIIATLCYIEYLNDGEKSYSLDEVKKSLEK